MGSTAIALRTTTTPSPVPRVLVLPRTDATAAAALRRAMAAANAGDGCVVYIAMHDSKQSIFARLRAMQNPADWPVGLWFATSAPADEEEFFEGLNEALSDLGAKTRLVVVDSLDKVRLSIASLERWSRLHWVEVLALGA